MSRAAELRAAWATVRQALYDSAQTRDDIYEVEELIDNVEIWLSKY